MSETNETEGKAARGGSKMTLNVRRTVESGHVRQSFSHGRSKSVLVEKKKRRAIGSSPAPQPVEDTPKPQPRVVAETPKKVQPEEADQPRPKGQVLRQLSDEEKDARSRALKDARQRDAERARAEQAAVLEVSMLEQRVKEDKVASERKVKEDQRHEAEAKARKVGEENVRKHLLKEEPEEPARTPDARHKKSPVAPRRGEERRVRGRLTIINALDEEQ